MKLYILYASIVFLFAFTLHFLRVINGWALQIGDWIVPVWFSFIAMFITGAILFFGIRLLYKK